jgi:hypothetical protein
LSTVNDAVRQELGCCAHDVNALLDRLALAPTVEEFSGLGRELQE